MSKIKPLSDYQTVLGWEMDKKKVSLVINHTVARWKTMNPSKYRQLTLLPHCDAIFWCFNEFSRLCLYREMFVQMEKKSSTVRKLVMPMGNSADVPLCRMELWHVMNKYFSASEWKKVMQISSWQINWISKEFCCSRKRC